MPRIERRFRTTAKRGGVPALGVTAIEASSDGRPGTPLWLGVSALTPEVH